MESHKYITLSYELYSDNAQGIHELIEKAPAEHPLQFISGFGTMLEAFEGNIVPLSEGDEFDFNLSVNEAYGPYVQEHVIELDKQVFTIDGRFDKENIYPGNVIPLTNADGNRFDGIIVEVKEKTVVVDLNHFLAGRDLHFCGKVIQSRPATDAEIQALLKAYLEIEPAEVMLYSLDRPTPEQRLQKVERDELERIAEVFRQKGIKVQVN